MMRHLICFAMLLSLGATEAAADWNRFRGPAGQGTVGGPRVPLEFSLEKNLAWRTLLPGHGVSSPIVNGNRVYLTAYTGYGIALEAPGDPKKLVRHLLAYDRSTGEELWRRSVESGGDVNPYKGFITQHGYATSTPVTDGDRIYALFGRSGLFAFDADGQRLWQRNLGTQTDPDLWGDASSPVLVGDVLVVNAGVLDRKVVGLDKLSGELLWSVQYDKLARSWSTPAVYRGAAGTQVLVSGPSKVMGLDPKTGETLWFATSPIDDATSPSLVIDGEVVYQVGSRAGQALAIQIGGQGDVTESHILWKKSVRAGITTPVLVDGALYWASGGIFMALDTQTGEMVYRERLPRLGGPTGGFPNVDYSSPIAVDGTVLLFTRSGESYAVTAGDEFKLEAHNAAFGGDSSSFRATPAVSGGELFMRSDDYLYKFSAAP
ncbi:MAG: PQQ-binding-like beta-propeller repeat protein [Acidobacteriota bacterium]